MATCDVYKGPIKLGSGTATSGSATISSYTSTGVKAEDRVNVQIAITSSTNAGATFRARVITDNGTSLVLSEASPYST
jgi:hypothetical protein